MKVLAIDDHALFREGLIMMLRRAIPEAEILQAKTIADALERYSFATDKIDVVLADLLYPGSKEPFIPLQALLAQTTDIPVVVISALESEFYVDYALKLGARGYVYKSRTSRDVMQAIQEVRRGGIYRPSADDDSAESIETMNGLHTEPENHQEVAANRNCVPALTPRQHDVLKYLMKGHSNKEIAKHLGLFEGTVKIHLKAILQRLGAQNRTQAVLIAAKYLQPSGDSGQEEPKLNRG
jgi:DNA-binding NarL/FixJ family response regulator